MLVCRRALGLLWPLVGSLGSCWFSALGGNQAFAVFPWRISACQCYVGSARIRVAWVTWVVPFVGLLLVGMFLWFPWFLARVWVGLCFVSPFCPGCGLGFLEACWSLVCFHCSGCCFGLLPLPL